MKKIISFALAIIMVFSLHISAFAAESSAEFSEDMSQNYHVSTVNPLDQIMTYGTSHPTTAWNVVTQGPYFFSGQAAYSTLYLSNLLHGTVYFQAYVTNKSSSNTLTVNPHDSTDLRPFTVAPNSSTNPLKRYVLQSGKQYFLLSFNAPSYFSGSVGEWIYQ